MKHIWKQIMLIVILVVVMAQPTFAADFSDVKDTNWYADDLDLMVEMGVISGYEDGTFRPQNPVTYGEFSKMLCSLTGTEVAEKTAIHWANGFANAVYELGWLEEYPSNLDQSISRYGVADGVFRMMGYEEDATLDSPFGDIDDGMTSTLYDLDIMKGSTIGGEIMFLPDSDVTRAEVCAILNRLVSADESGMFDVEMEEAAEEMVEEVSVKTDYTYTLPNIAKPDSNGTISAEYFDQVIGYMMVNDIESFSCNFENRTWEELKAAGIYGVCDASFLRTQDKYHELGCFYTTISQKMSTGSQDTTFTITIYNEDYSYDEIVAYKAAFIKEVNKLAASMYADGSISASDSDYNKALYFYRWCALNLQYDNHYQPESYTGYGALINGTAVCQGYTAVFNALCNASDIECYGISGDEHIWNYANLDGTWLYVDVTYGDPVPDRAGYCDPSYFGLTKAEILGTHIFDAIYQ